jgi:16S rRNA (guanine966-N2)-methyltransferase
VRVIAGQAKGRTLKMVPGRGTRPIADRVKGALFNIVSWRVPGCRFLDLFAGTGSVGIEALSRTAAEAVFVEKAPHAIRVLRENLERTGLGDRARIVPVDVFRFIEQASTEPGEPFDIIYIAPPQYQELWSQVVLALDAVPVSVSGRDPLLASDGIIVAQMFPKEFQPLPLKRYVLCDQRTYGSTMLCFYEHSSAPDSSLASA